MSDQTLMIPPTPPPPRQLVAGERQTALAARPGCPKLSEALALARDKCKAAAKSSRNTHHGYAYASADEVIDTASEALHGSGLAVIPVSEELTVLGSGQLAIYALNRELMLTHSSGEFVPLEVRGWPVVPDRGRPLDKAYAIALTSSLSYKLRDLLQMPRGTQDDVAAQDDRQTPASPPPQPNGGPAPNPQAPAQGPTSPATITEEQERLLADLVRQKGRTPQDVQALLASLGLRSLAQLPQSQVQLAARILTDGPASTEQLDRISALVTQRGYRWEAIDSRLLARYGAPRLRLLTAPQAAELEAMLLAPPKPQPAGT